MGHSINYRIYEENKAKGEILSEVLETVRNSGDGYGTSNIKFIDKGFENEDEAYNYINAIDTGWYDGYAVKFKDYSNAKKTAKISEYEAKIEKLIQEKKKYKEEHSVHTFKAKHIGCEKCGSKLNKEYLIGESCPLCRNDLRSKTTLDKIKWYEDKVAECRNKIEVEKKKQTKNVKVNWLVKYEYHC